MSVEKEKITPRGVLLAQETQKAVSEWAARRKKADQDAKTKSGGRPRPQREKRQIYQNNSANRGEFIGQKIAHLLPEEGFSQLLGNHINSCLQGRDISGQLEEIGQGLVSLSEEQLGLVFQFYQLRQGFTRNPEQADLTRQQIEAFNLEFLDQIPDTGFLPGLFRTISNRYPDPKSLKKTR